MTQRVANCPSCGAEITFRWSGAVQTTCSHCGSILVRHDVDLAKVGVVSEPPPITSRVQVGTEGRYGGKPFTVVGRIAYAWERGGWSEWHIVFGDGRSGWLSDAQAEYAVTFQVLDPGLLPSLADLRPGATMPRDGATFEVATVTKGRYAGVEGELPFEYWDHTQIPFVDLRSDDGRLATIDFSEERALLFIGESVELASLQLVGLREEVEARVEGVRTLNCPACGGSVTVRYAELAVTVGCAFCGAVLDARSPGFDVVQKASEKMTRVVPRIPLGSKGKLRGQEYEVLGLQERTITVEHTPFSWREYLLFSPAAGYRYLSEYDYHWNDIITLKAFPKVDERRMRPVARLHGESFRHFQSAVAETRFIIGEFPWEVRRGDKVMVDDYVSPPRMLSSETTPDERTWSLGEYTEPERVWQAFDLKGEPPEPRGIFANQPSAIGSTMKFVVTFVALSLLLSGLYTWRSSQPHSRVVAREQYFYDPATPDSAAIVLGPFTLEGRPSNLEVELDAEVSNAWIYFTVSLLNVATGETVHFGREISYYFGRDADGRWSEGSQVERPRLPSIPPGEYMVRVVPEGPTAAGYRVRLRRDVPARTFFIVAFIAVAAPAAFSILQHVSFESKRWQESDYSAE